MAVDLVLLAVHLKDLLVLLAGLGLPKLHLTALRLALAEQMELWTAKRVRLFISSAAHIAVVLVAL